MQRSVRVEHKGGWHRVTLDRPDTRNGLDPSMVDALRQAVEDCVADPGARLLLLEGSDGHFCSGMNLAAAAGGGRATGAGGAAFLDLLRRIDQADIVVVSLVDGQAAGGGVGLAAASDIVLATERAQFSLPEALWGLLPCLVAPFVVRRTGVAACRRMTLSTLPLGAAAAARVGLVDEVIASPTETEVAHLVRRVTRLAEGIIGPAKQYLSRLAPIDDAAFATALHELDRLLESPEVLGRLRDFSEHNRYPWERSPAGQVRP